MKPENGENDVPAQDEGDRAHLVFDLTFSNAEGPDECLPSAGCDEGFFSGAADAPFVETGRDEDGEATGWWSGGGASDRGTVRERGEGVG